MSTGLITSADDPPGEELWRDGPAIYYRVLDRLGGFVILKVLPVEDQTPFLRARFRREVVFHNAVRSPRSPHIVPVLDFVDRGYELCQFMPWVDGNLRMRLAKSRWLAMGEAVNIVRILAEALGYVHERGWVHCNLRPETIWLTGEHAALADFSLVWPSGKPVPDPPFGTPAYMSPEQTQVGHLLDGRTDLYSLGCVLYELLTGRLPFQDPSAADLLESHRLRVPTPVRELRPDVSSTLQQIVHRLLEKDPTSRFQSADQLLKALVAA